ncbi:phosphorylase b kinase regulatory subunit beta-like isoform X2 [Branchiostoma lanceolatum]|uniref:phosphorylase b kinase regulatory subunit beta-like isoform X2 n=1 Tax=Branchiostoma lanceolatum TaxID=7740 RepID=UPI00345616F9
MAPGCRGEDDIAVDSESRQVNATMERLDHYYTVAKNQLLSNQSPTLGLFRLHTDGASPVSKVRDNIYCATAVWGLALAYRRIDDDRGRTHELEHCTVKCMRGILYCYMRQAEKVELFKQGQEARHCLHSEFHWQTGDALKTDNEAKHLQIDAPSLYLLYLAQMISSGLQIIYTTDEVSFVQNLVYYIERAYRLPDYGVWERGSKYNNGNCELHTSSIAMAKAALEAMNGFNLFGKQGASWSVIYVDIDAHNRNRVTVSTLLPRESSSKNTDAALLSVVSFPAFAVDDEALRYRTQDKVIRKLQGQYGFKRFLRDGYSTVLEDKKRKYYKPAEIKLFDGIECEWPVFYIYMIIDGVFRNKEDQVEKYCRMLQPLLQDKGELGVVIPKYYFVSEENVEAERKAPGTQKRVASDEGTNGKLFLWGQSLYLIACLLVEGLLSTKELDPIGKNLPPGERSSVNSRYSSFRSQSYVSDQSIQMVLIAESTSLQATLAMYGIQTQTPQQVEPIQIWPPGELVKVYEFLGVNKKLGLTGRPPRPIGSLGTSKIYRILGRTVLCYPLVFNLSDFYMSQDMSLLIDDIKDHLQFVSTRWELSGRPTFCVLLRDENIRSGHMSELLDMLAAFKRGEYAGVKIRLGNLQTLMSTACVEHLDFMLSEYIDIGLGSLEVKPLEEREDSNVLDRHTRKSSTGALHHEEEDVLLEDMSGSPTWEVIQHLQTCTSLKGQSLLLRVLLKREGPNFITDEGTIVDRLERLCRKAGDMKYWSVVRLTASLCGKLVDSLAPSITNVLVRGKQVTLGVFGHEEEVISNPLSPGEIKNIVYSKCMPHDEREAVLQQEMIIYIGNIISTTPELFDGILKIRAGWFIQAMKNELKASSEGNQQDIHGLSPSAIKQLLLTVLTQKREDWLHRRQLDGALGRTPKDFYDKVWQILERSPAGFTVSGFHLPQQPTLSDMTLSEMNFALLVERMLGRIAQPEYRQVMVEMLMVLSTILYRNPELEFQGCVELDKLVQESFQYFQQDQSQSHGQEKQDDMTAFFNTPAGVQHGTTSYLAKAAVNRLLQGNVNIDQNEPCTVS